MIFFLAGGGPRLGPGGVAVLDGGGPRGGGWGGELELGDLRGPRPGQPRHDLVRLARELIDDRVPVVERVEAERRFLLRGVADARAYRRGEDPLAVVVEQAVVVVRPPPGAAAEGASAPPPPVR